jgi:hypothetical protein
MLKFSPANAKTAAMSAVDTLKPFLANKRKIYSLDLLSGYSCPFAKACLSKAKPQDNGKLKIWDGPDNEFRCFSASQEAQYTNVYNARKHNFDMLRGCTSAQGMADLIINALPANLGICRIHVAGDFFNQNYFDAWLQVSRLYPDRLFYAYTKSLNFWLARRQQVNSTPNFVLTASYGGRLDSLIKPRRLRNVKVVFTEAEAGKLPIDHDDSHAADPSVQKNSFALLLHGTQPKGSNAAVALKELKGKGSYSR